MKQHLTALGPGQPGYAPEQRCLAAAVGAVQANALTGMQRKIHIAQHGARRVALPVCKADALKAENGCSVMVVRH